MTRYEDGDVAVGEIAMWVHRLNDDKPFLWEYPKVTVLGVVKGKRATWLRVLDEAGQEHCVLARRIYGEEAARGGTQKKRGRSGARVPTEGRTTHERRVPALVADQRGNPRARDRLLHPVPHLQQLSGDG